MTIETLTSWSFSSLKEFERCPYSQFLKRIRKVERPAPKEGAANVRGQEIHNDAECFVDGRLPKLTKELKKFSEQFEALKELYDNGQVALESEWGFTLLWEPCGYNDYENVWLRVKGDAIIMHDESTFTIIDYKTGKSFGNEVPHNQQGQLYAVALMCMFPKAEAINVEFWYTDEGKTTRRNYTRKKLAPVMARFNQRAEKMTQTTEFQPKPNVINCRWCDYGPANGNGKCQYGVSNEL